MTVVTTADALIAAVSSGARDIEIRSHLDLTSVPKAPSSTGLPAPHPVHGLPTHLLYIPDRTRSIRVRSRMHRAAQYRAVPRRFITAQGLPRPLLCRAVPLSQSPLAA